MIENSLILPNSNQIKSHVISSLDIYWQKNKTLIELLPVNTLKERPKLSIPLRLVPIKLPQWACELGVNGEILIPIELTENMNILNDNSWVKVDWWLAAFLLMECWHERSWEMLYGPIHSYSFKLKGWDQRAWEHAWVNRIGLFLRRWTVVKYDLDAVLMIGNLPKKNLEMTHDVDAVEKTISIRLKQAIFNIFNFIKQVKAADYIKAKKYIFNSLRFLFSKKNWQTFDKILDIEKKFGIKSTFNFYSNCDTKNPKQWLFDPGYCIKSHKLKLILKKILLHGHNIGLHPAYSDWKNTKNITRQRKLLENVLLIPVESCRQHWLRFSWKDTWESQSKAGILTDTTLMFNDRSGFRNSSAIEWHPWDQKELVEHKTMAKPTILMDSHLYDYDDLNQDERQSKIDNLLNECKFVNGNVAILWHPHTISEDYGWLDSFSYLITQLFALSMERES